MRAFCAKHSAIRGISSISELDSRQVELHDGKVVTRKEQQVRFTRSNKDKFVNDAISTSSCSLNKSQAAEVAMSPSIVGSAENQEISQSTDMVVDQPTADGNLISNPEDVSGVLRKVFIWSSYKVILGYGCCVLNCILSLHW